MQHVFLSIGTGNEEVVYIPVTAVKAAQHVVHEPLKCLLRPKGIHMNSKRPNGVVTAVLGMSSSATGIWWNARTKSMRSSTQCGGEVLKVWDRVAVRNCVIVECSVVATWTPVAWCFLGHHVQQQLEEGRTIPSSSIIICSNSCRAIKSLSGASLWVRLETGEPVVSM